MADPTTTVCRRCVMDATVPGLDLDAGGECRYCRIHDALDRDFPNDERGAAILRSTVETARRRCRGSRYDCVIGVSGGTDSMFLLHWAAQAGLRPLAFHLDNGWDSAIAVTNIYQVLRKFHVDLVTHVVRWEEMRDILVSFLRAGLPWADAPTDMAIVAGLYRAAERFGIKTVMVGNNFRTEGKQPLAWTYHDGRQVRAVHRRFGRGPMRTFPNQSAARLLVDGAVRGIRIMRPFYYMPYNKDAAKEFLGRTCGWTDYGGHHHESVFTRFVIADWLPNKFGIDKRKVTFSALVRSGEMTRAAALEQLGRPPYDPARMAEDRAYVIKKLGLTPAEFRAIWDAPNRAFTDYPSYYPLYRRLRPLARFLLRQVVPDRPMTEYLEDAAPPARPDAARTTERIEART